VDWLDKLSIAAIAGIAVVTIGMLASHELMERRQHNPGGEAKTEESPYALQMEEDARLFAEVRTLEEQGRYQEAMAEVKGIMENYPEKPTSYVYLGRMHFKQGELAQSIAYYRQAVEMEPDYVDERTPLFIGEEIKEIVEEGREKFGREKELKPDDQQVRDALKHIYYLQSRLAGGCE
jgi:tetratricopeptide (TPR) repeat protein